MDFLSQVMGLFIFVTIHAVMPLESSPLDVILYIVFIISICECMSSNRSLKDVYFGRKNHMYGYYIQFDFEMVFLC